MRNLPCVARKMFWIVAAAWLLRAVSAAAEDVSVSLPSPLKDSIGSVESLVEVLLNDIVLPLGATVVAIFIIYTGFLYVKAQGNPPKLAEAHKALTWTIVGAAVVLGAVVLSGLIKGTIEQLR